DKSIRKKRHETQHPGIEENHQVKLLLDRLEKAGISANKLSPSLWKHISDCYSGTDCSSAVSKGIVTQLVGLPAVKVFRLPIGGKIKRLKSNLCNVIEDSTPQKSKDSDQEVNNESNHSPERLTSPIQKSIVQCGDSTEHNEIISTKEEPIDIVEDIYETEFVSVSEDFNQKLTPELNVTAKTEKETEFVEVEEMFDGKSTTEPRDIPIVREESHFIIVDTASRDIKTESIWDSNSFELLEARSNDSNILDKAHTDVPPTDSVIGNDAERIIDYTDTNDNIESEPFDNCDQPTFSVSSSLWQKPITNTSPLRANLLDPVLEYEINQDIPTAQKRSGAINLQPAVPQKTRKIAPKQIPTQQSIYTATNPNNSGLQEGVNTVVEGFSQPISQQPSIAAPQTKIQQDTIISFQQLEENKNLPVSLQDVSNTKYQPLHASISLISASNVHPEMKPLAYSQNVNTYEIMGVRTFENRPKEYVLNPIDGNYTPVVDVYQPLSDTFTESNNLNQKCLKSLHTLNNIKQPSLDNLQSPVVPSVVSQASTMARSSWHVVQKDCNEMIAVVPPHTLGMQITNDTVNPSTTVVIPSDSDSCRNTATSQSSVETDVYRQEADDLFYNIYSSSNTISNSKSLKNVELENNPILENTTNDDNDNDNGWESCENNFEDENHHNSNVETCGQVDVQIGDSENFEKYILRSANKIICKLCEKSFEQNEEYKSHMKLHLKASHFFCRKCKIDVPIISFLNFHLNSCMKNLPPKDLVVLSSDDEPEPTPEANYKCKVCGEKFGFRINLKYHKETHVNNKAKYTFLCPLCGQAFKTKNDFRFHKSQHHNSNTNSHACNECGQTFKLLIELEVHKSEQHKQKLTCPNCPATFSLSSSLKTHMSEHRIGNTSEVINIGD
ncbi:unnamed protein product, partial [Timema podura]|nr:unnamed protein product [Timema podura]